MRRTAVLSLAILSIVALTACRGSESAKAAQANPPAPAASQPQRPASQPALAGTVAETMNAGGYTYARLQVAGKGDVWIAAREFSTRPGDQLSVNVDMPMENFESKTLKRTFPMIYFASSVTRDGQPVAGAASSQNGMPSPMSSHGSGAAPAAATVVEPVAPPAGGMSIGDVWAKRAALAGRNVTVRGKVVKVNSQIMGRNWVHLRDGSGSEKDQTNDLTITTSDDVTVGDVVTFTGTLAADKDFSAGYKYGAILENAKLVK